MGGNCCRNEEKTFDIVAGNIIHGDDNVIIDNRTKPYIHPSTSTLSDGSQSERSNRVYVEDIVHGHRNHISKGQSSKKLPTRSCTTSTNGTTSQEGSAGDMAKKNDDKDYIRNREIVVKASRSVGIIRGPGRLTGTGFRVGEYYIMTALHVVDNIMKILQDPSNKQIDYTKVVHEDFYIEFGYKTHNRKQNPDDLFNFSDLVYKNNDLDTAILQLSPKQNQAYPPSIGIFSPLIEDIPVYLIGHPNGEPMMDDPKIEIYEYSEEEVKKSKEWAITTGLPNGNCYEGINNQRKTLFHCASQHGASGALGVMVMPHHDEPIAVLMLLKGYPGFYHSTELSFSDTEKEHFLIVEQGVLLKSIEHDMELDSEYPRTPRLKNEIFSHRIE